SYIFQQIQTTMKTTNPLLAISCFLIFFAFTTKPFYASAEFVVDTDGEPLQWFTNYYVRIIILGPLRAGPGLGTLNNQSCPLYVSYETESYGFPVTFSPVLSKLPFIPTSTELNIHTSALTICIQTLVWKIVPDSKSGVSFAKC
ncbi:Kunitz trypsin inhibitor, partial [Quillaja saponaria]